MGQKNAKILPAFKNESLTYIKLGLRFFNQSELIDPVTKETFFNYISAWHNQSFRAFYGQRGDHTNPWTQYLPRLGAPPRRQTVLNSGMLDRPLVSPRYKLPRRYCSPHWQVSVLK